MSISAAGQIGGEHWREPRPGQGRERGTPTAVSRHLTVVAASGDIGAVAEPCDVYRALTGSGTFTPVKEVNLLASDPLVLGAGGISLTASHTTGAWQGETAWGLPYGDPGSAFQASGGPVPQPGYQDGVSGIRATRGVPDASADASGRVTKGNNTVQFPPKTITGYQAAPGWDPVIGWGSPDAQVLIPLLARYAVP